MKIFLYIVAVLLVLMGGVWFLQGMNVLLGSPMTGQMTWVINGGIVVVVGIVLFVWNYRRKG